MDNGIWNSNMLQLAALGSGGGSADFTVTLSGLVDTAFQTGVAEQGRVVTAQVQLNPQAGAPALSYQWATLESGDIPGATSASLTVDAANHDLENLLCRVTADGIGLRQSSVAVVRHVPPSLTAALSDEIFDLGSGDQMVPLAGVFGGAALSVTLPVDGGISSYNAQADAVVIQTAALVSGVTLTVRASNSGGLIETSFLVTVEADSGALMVDIDPATAAGAGGVPVTGASIVSGDPAGHWQVSGGELSPSVAGDAADLSGGPYSLTLDDGQEILVRVAPGSMTAMHWAVSGPRPTGVDLVVFEAPSDNGTPLTSLEMRMNGGAWQPIGGVAPGVYSVQGLTPETSYRVELRASNGATGTGEAQGLMTVPEDPRGFRGWDPQVDLGTAADLYVAPWGDDAGPASETQPLLTVTEALDRSVLGDTIRLRAGTYRERLTLPSTIRLEGYGTEKPRITAANRLSGLTRCTSADAVILGPVLGINGSPVFKAQVPLSELEFDDPVSMNLHEAGRRMNLAVDKADNSDPFARADEETFYAADLFTANASDEIETVRDADILTASRYGDAQLLAAKAMVYGRPNIVTVADITAVNLPANEITIDTSVELQSTDPADWLWSLINIAPRLGPGTFAITDDGTTATVWVYPYDELNLDLIEYSARERVITLDTAADNCTLRGLHLSQPIAENISGGFTVYRNSSSSKSSGHVLEHCLHTGSEGLLSTARAIRLVNVDSTVVTRNTFYDITGRGLFFSSSGGFQGTGNLVSRNHFQKIGGAGFYAYSQHDHVEAHNYAKDTGLEAHANKSNHYSPSNTFAGLLFWGNEFENCRGYIVWQNCSSPNVAFNWAPIKQSGAPWHRTITDDNQSGTLPEPNSLGFVFNNAVLPNTALPQSGLGIDVARPSADILYTLNNNIAHGMSSPEKFGKSGDNLPPAASIRGNVVTYLDVPNGQSVASFGPDNVVQLNLPQVYMDATTQDYRPALGSPILTTVGIDMSADIAQLATRFAQFTDFDRDVGFNVIDWAQLPIGPDTTLPFVRSLNLQDVTGTPTGAATADLSVQVQQAGVDLYVGVWPEASPPVDAAALQAGTGAVFWMTQTVASGGVQTIPATGLTASTQYRVHALAVDGSTVGPMATSALFETPGANAGLILVDQAFAASSAYKNSSAYDAISYTPQEGGNELLVAIALHNGATNAAVTWRGQTLPALFVNTIGDAFTRLSVVALYRAPAGAGAGGLVVTPSGTSNALTVAFLEVSGLATQAIPSGQVVGETGASTTSTSITATLPGITSGNAALALTVVTGNAGPFGDTGSMLSMVPGGQVTSGGSGGGLSDMSMQAQFASDITTASVTAAADYQNQAQCVMVVAELSQA